MLSKVYDLFSDKQTAISEDIQSHKNITDVFSQPEGKTMNAISSTWSVANYLIPVTFRVRMLFPHCNNQMVTCI